MHKTCTACKQELSLTCFYIRGGRQKNTPSSECKACTATRKKKYYIANKDTILEKQRARDLKRTHLYATELYLALFEKQKGICAICKKPSSVGTKLCVDHDHVTNEIRGLLCRGCNAGLGMFKDKIANLNAAISYLENSN